MTITDNPEAWAARSFDRALVSRGDTARLEHLFRKAAAGGAVTIAFLGGSITQGCHASVPESRYVDRVFRWFRESFPLASVTCINAGVGATTSLVGVHRVRHQVLEKSPDLVIVDFAVNDTKDTIFRESYESLIRDLLCAPSAPAVLELFMMIEGGFNEQETETEIGRHYGIPMISYRDFIQDLLRDGTVTWSEVSTDEVHPNDAGHGLCAGLITAFFSSVYSRLDGDPANYTPTTATADRNRLPVPIYSDRFCNGTILASENLKTFRMEGFEPNPRGFQVFPNGWKLDWRGTAERCQGRFTVDIEARNIVLLYKKTIKSASGTITVRHAGANDADSNEPPMILDTFFRDGWGDYAETAEIVRGAQKARHTIEITAEGPATILGFLVS